MAYSSGRTRLIREMGKEEAFERKRYERELADAESAQRKESGASSLWQGLGSLVGAGVGFFAGGPAGAYKGFHLGKEAGRWGRRLGKKVTGTEYDPKDFDVSTDVGTFGQSQKYDLEDINMQFEEAEESRFWQDVTGTGTSLLSLATAPKMAGKEWWTATGEGGKFGAPDWLRKFHPQNPNLRDLSRYAR